MMKANWGVNMKKKDFLVGLMMFAMFAHVESLQASGGVIRHEDQITERVISKPTHQTCLTRLEDKSYLYAERNLADFYNVNKENIIHLYNRGVINSQHRTQPDEEDIKALKSILLSATNIAYDAKRYPEDLERDLDIWINDVWSTDQEYQVYNVDTFRNVTSLKRVLYLLKEMYYFVG